VRYNVAFSLLLFCYSLALTAQSSNPAAQTTADEIRKLQQQYDENQKATVAALKAALAAQDATKQALETATKANVQTQQAQDAVQKSESAAGVLRQQTDAANLAITAFEAERKAVQAAIDQRRAALQPTPAIAASNGQLQDHVPCIMGRTQLYASRGMQDPVVLTSADQQANNNKLVKVVPDNQKAAFSASLKPVGPMTATAYQQKVLAASQMLGPEDANSVVDAVKALTDTSQGDFVVPKDIGCSMSVFPWNIARMVFGRTVANNYLAVQVVVRNLDNDHEFLIHDAELAVDSYSSQLERFQVGHEKQAVRAVVVYGQNYDRRASWSRSVEAIGTILGSIVSIPDSNDILTSATGAYTSGFMPSWTKLFPDLTTQNLNNLNDLGFSAAAASRIVVPKGGSVPFVVFIPVKPLEQACWLQTNYVPWMDIAPNTSCTATPNGDPMTLPAGTYTSPWDQNPPPSPIPGSTLKSVRFKDWNAAQLTALQKHAYAVIAGSHIQAIGSNPALRSITCDAQDTAGLIHIALLNGKDLNCTLTGADLSSAKTLQASSASTPGASPIKAPVTTNGDSTLAKATFAAADVSKFTDPIYQLHALDSAGTDTDLKQTLNILPAPTIDSKSFDSSTVAAMITAQKIKFNGTHLAQVTSVLFKVGDQTVATLQPTVGSSSDTLMTAALPADFKDPGKTINIMFLVGSTIYDPHVTFPPTP